MLAGIPRMYRPLKDCKFFGVFARAVLAARGPMENRRRSQIRNDMHGTPVLTIRMPVVPNGVEHRDLLVKSNVKECVFEYIVANLNWLVNYIQAELQDEA